MEDLSVSVSIDAKSFRDFAVFDAFKMKKRWRPPLLFALIMLGFAVLCFCFRQREAQAVLIGSVLIVVGVGLPIVYFFSFLNSVNAHTRKLGLSSPQPVYSVTLDDFGIDVVIKGGEKAHYRWEDFYGAYRGKNCVYLYVEINRAYLLPDSDVGNKDDILWRILKKHGGARVVE